MSKSRDDVFQQIQTVDELKQFINCEESQCRIVFVLKIFYILQFVKKHPIEMERIGASWCKDNFHFVANSNKLAEFLELKSNSINTNFRAHGFKIISCNMPELKKEFPDIKETRHWKIRYSNCSSFRSSSKGEDVKNIKLIGSNTDLLLQNSEKLTEVESLKEDFSFIPKETMELLQPDLSQIINLVQMFYAVTEDNTFYRNFLTYITDLWKTKIESNKEYAPIQTILSVILGTDMNEASETEIDQVNELYAQNLEYLLPQNYENSQICDYLSFVSFAKYFMRYGDQLDFSSTLREITLPVISEELEPSFHKWFYPSTDKSHAITLLSKQKTESWLILPSKGPNKFTLLFTRGKPPLDIQALHIKHNPIPDNPSKRYSVTFNDGEKYGQTLDEIFTNVLNLHYPDIQSETSYQLPEASYVSADSIANRNDGQNNDQNSASTTDNYSFVDSFNDKSESVNYMSFGGSQTESQTSFDQTFSLNSQYDLSISQDNWGGISQNSQTIFTESASQLNDIFNENDE